jgi:hypothetical protein
MHFNLEIMMRWLRCTAAGENVLDRAAFPHSQRKPLPRRAQQEGELRSASYLSIACDPLNVVRIYDCRQAAAKPERAMNIPLLECDGGIRSQQYQGH